MAFLNVRTQRSIKDYKARVETGDCDNRVLYRFDKENLEWIATHFLGETTETRGGALTSLQKMKIFLRYMSDPDFQSGVGEDIGVDQTTVSKIVHQVRKKIMEKANLWIKFPVTPAEIQSAKDEWAKKFKIPTVIGVIDCTHIRIQKPCMDGDEFVCRKGFASLNVQSTCDANENFTSTSAEWPGSVHDSRILKNSSIWEFLQTTNETVLLGDSGYGISPWLITPYSKPSTQLERNFNAVYAKERVIIERCFGQVKRRFPILQYKIRTALITIPSIITCCFVLHNVAKFLNDPDDFQDFSEQNEDTEGDETNEVEVEQEQQARLSATAMRQRGQATRNRLAQILNIL